MAKLGKSVVLLGGAVMFLAAEALAQGASCAIFFNKQEFEQFNAADGKFLKGIEDFEESNIPDGFKIMLPAPLKGNVSNVNAAGLGFPTGLSEKNIIIQDNTFTAPNPPAPHPSGQATALYVVGPGFLGSNSKKVGEDLFLQNIIASIDLLFTEPNHTGVGFELSRFEGFPNAGWHITVYDKNDDEICRFDVPPPPNPEPVKTFVGVWSPATIGRINIFDQAGPSPDAIDNIQLWEEQTPVCPWDCALPHNKKIDVVDFLALLAQWGQQGPCNFDGDALGVDVTDFLKLLAHWGNCPVPANDECPGQSIDRVLPVGTIEVHFDMYGATPSPQPHACVDIVPVKDTWYCLNYVPGPVPVDKLVSISCTVPLLIEVTAGCACTAATTLVACGFGPAGTPQFLMHPGDKVTIRLSNTQNLPNDQLKGNLLISNKLLPPPPHVNLFEDPQSFFLAVDNAGKDQKFFWNFKPNAAPAGSLVTLQSPLDISTHMFNLPDPWSVGPANLWPPAVDNVQFTANVNPQGPLQIPPGPSLLFAPAGTFPSLNNNFLGVNVEPGSFDIISGPPQGTNHTAIAFELALIGPPVGLPSVVHVTVYDKQDIVLAKFPVTVFTGEKHFVGVLSKDTTIGRIDLWAPQGGKEGITAIWAYAQGPGVNFFLNEADFFGAVDAAGKTNKFLWNFKPDFLPAGAQVLIAQPLDINTHFVNAPGVWFLPAAGNLWPPPVDNVQFWSNANPQGPLTPGPGLIYWKGGQGLPFTNNLLLAGPAVQASFDILSGPPAGDNHTAFAFELFSIGPVAPLYHVTVYDKLDQEMGKWVSPIIDPPFSKIFLGILSKDPQATIGRVDIWDSHNGQEGISSIAAWSHN